MWPEFESEDQVPEAFRGMYEERGGKWLAKELGDGGKAALEAERKARKEAEDRAREAERLRAEAELEAKAKKAGLTDEQLVKLRADVRADIEREYASKALQDLPEGWAARNEGTRLMSDLRTLRLDQQVKALAAPHLRGEKLEQWWKLNADRFDLTDDGKPMVRGAPGKEVATFIAEDLKKEIPEFYKGTQAAGGGAGGLTRDGKPIAGTTADDIIRNPAAALEAARSAA